VQAPDHRRAVFTFVAAETPSNPVAVIAISAAVFFTGDRMGRLESETWKLEAARAGLAARIGPFGGADLTFSAGQRRCPNPAAYPNCRSWRRSCQGRLAMKPRVARLGCQPLDPVGRPRTCRGSRPRAPIGSTTFFTSVTADSRRVCDVGRICALALRSGRRFSFEFPNIVANLAYRVQLVKRFKLPFLQ
jgi:hypothetical protein